MYNAKIQDTEPALTLNPDEVITTIYAWDCECEHNFIHAKNTGTLFDINECSRCNSKEGEQPDGRVNEVLEYIEQESNHIFDLLDEGHGDVFDTYHLGLQYAKWKQLVESGVTK